MSTWNIYHKDGSKLTDVNGEQITVHGLEYSDSWMGECFVAINFKHEVPINFQIGDYIVYRGERFELNYEPGKDKQARPDTYGEGFIYDSVKFNALQDELARAEFLDVVLNDNELHYTSLPKFPFFVQTLDDLLDRIQANLDEQIGAGLWKIYSRNKERSVQRGALESEWLSVYGEKTDDNVIESMSITVDSKKCWDALALVNEKWDVNFIVRGRNIYVGTTGIEAGHIFSYGLGKGLYEIVQNADSDQSVITRLRAYGSEKNLPSHYYADLGIKYVANITKVIGASTNVELELDIDYIETYFKNKRKYVVSGESQEQSNGWVLQVTFDFQTTITGYVTQSGSSGKCRFYSELKGGQVDSGDEESKEKLDTFIAQVNAGNTKMYITSGLNKKAVPSSMKEYAENLPNNMAINRLMLPGFPHVSLSNFYDSLTEQEKKYVNPTGKLHKFSTDPYRPYIDSLNIEEIGLRSASQFFDTDDKTNGVIEIYPTIEEMEIGGVRVDEIDEGVAPDDDGRFGDNETVKNIDIYLNKAIDFDINDLKDDDFSISMKDGMCGGRTFKVASSTKVDGRWRLTIERSKDDALELWFPYKDYPIKSGDHFVLTGITLPDSYVKAASLKLLKYAISLLDKNDYTRYVYQPKVDELFMARQHDLAQADETGVIKSLHDTLKAGDLMNFNDTDLNIEGIISIDHLTIKEEDGKIPTYDITLREDKEVGTIQKMQQQISSLQSGNGGTGAGLTTTQVKNQVATEGSKHFISKINDDTAKGTVTWEKVQKFLQGLNIGDGNSKWSADGTLILFRLLTNNFSSGPYGQGAQIDEKGDMEVNSIYARQFISAPKFVFNEISVTKAEQWNTNGYGTIESVDVENRTITLHLEENDYGSLQVGDICRGLYADIDNAHGADKIEEGALDDCNFVQHKGFFSTYFYVTHIITNEKGKFVFKYGKKSSVTPDPCAYMDFAQYGSFTDEKRQSSMYFSSRGNSFIEVLDGVKTWEVQSQNRVARYGWLGGLLLVKKDGSTVRPEGNGIYVQDNIYFGGNINYLQGLSGLDDLREEAKAYDVSLSQYQSVITVDDMGNVINGLYTEDEEKTTKQYRISTAVFVRKGMDILLEEDGNTEDVTAGHYRVHAVSEDCEVMVQNSTIFVTAIRNIKDGVAGTKDDENFDYDAMRKATDAMVTIVVELEGKTSKMVQMPIRIQHDTLPFMVCDLSNESASVAWNTKTAKYIGLPIKTKVSLMYHNEPWAISSLNISKVAGLKTSMSIEGKAKVITIDADNLTADTLAQITKMNITVVGRYAGANYEYTRELTILKSSDTVVYELIPSADSIVVDKDGNKTVNSVSCDVYATSSDDKRYKLTALPSGMTLKYGNSENATTAVALGTAIDVSASDKMVTFALYDSKNNMLDKESIPVLAYGKDGKGIEYIFKLQNSAPSNPTPSDYATNAEYQRTDYVPTTLGWTDDPTGVDAVNQYEWVSKRVSTNGHWGPFSAPAEYAHFGKHAPKAKSSDDIVTIPTDSNGNALLAFSEEVGFSLLVDGHECNISSIQRYSSTLSHVSCSISGNVATITCEEGAALGITSQTIVFKVTGTLDGSTYIDYVTVKIVPNVTGADGDGYEYIYYQSNYLNNDFSAPKRTNGKLTDGWQDDLMAPTEDKRYVFVAYKRGELGSDGEFSMPQLFNRYPRSIISQETKFIAWHSLTDAPDANEIWYHGSTDMPKDFSDDKPWLWKVVRTNYTEGDPEYTVSCEGYKAKDGDGLIVGYQSSASEPSVLPTPKTLADYDKAQDDIGSGWTKTAPTTGGKSIVLGGKITTDEIIDRYNSSTSAWGTEESEILLDGIKQKKTFYKTPSSLGNNGKCIRRIKVVNHFRDSYLRVMMKSYSEANYDLVCISRLYLPSEVINSDGNQIKEDSEYLSKSKYAYKVSGDGQSLVAELSMPDAGEYYFFIGYFKDGSNDSYGDYGLFAWQAMIALTESLWRTDGTVDAVGNITWSKAMPMQAEAIVMERAYIATTNDTKAPAKPYRTNGILQGGWTAKRLAVSSTNRFIWESVRTGKHGTDSVQDDWSLPVVVANFAEAGKMGKNGCIVRNSEGWKSGATYHNDSALTKEQKYIDLIYIEDNNANDGWSIYQCNVTHTATGSSFDPSAVDSDKNKLWTKLSDTGPMYSPLIVAKNAVLKFAQGQQFNLMEGNNIFGSFRWVKDDADYAFWIGGTEGSNATTSITRGGKLKSTSAEITGKITATSGKVGGLKIEGDSLTNEGFNNDAYIVLRNDTNKVFAGIGGNVLPATAGYTRAVARFTIENTSDSFIGGINYAIICGAKGKATNVALDMTLGGYITGLRIKNTYLASGGSIYSQAVDIPKNAHSVVLAGSGYYRLPQMEKEDDGYIIFVKRATDSGTVHLLAGFARDSKDGFHTSALYYDRGNGTTDLEIKSSGDAMILVYHRDMTITLNSTTYQGCWIQYKCPRDW